jgi:hypothetical protein
LHKNRTQNMAHRFLFIFLFCLAKFSAFSQDTIPKVKVATKKPKTVTDTKAKSSTATKPKFVRPKIEGPLKIGVKIVPGYRLQVLTTTDRNLALNMKAKVYSLFPREQTYMQIKTPYYAIHVGNYLKKDDAKKAKVKLANALKTSVYIIGADVTVRYYPQLEPPPSNYSVMKKKSTIYSYGGRGDEKGLDPLGKKKKKKKAAAPKAATPAPAPAAPAGGK